MWESGLVNFQFYKKETTLKAHCESRTSYIAWLDLYLLGVGRNLVPLGLGLGSAPRQQGKNLPGKWDCRARKLDSGNQLLIGAETRSLLSIIETLVRSTLVKCVLPMMMMHFHIQILPTKNQTHDTDSQYRKANTFPRKNSSQWILSWRRRIGAKSDFQIMKGDR